MLALARDGLHTRIIHPRNQCVLPPNLFNKECEPAAEVLVEINSSPGPAQLEFVRKHFPPADGHGLALAKRLAPTYDLNALFSEHGTVETLRRVPFAQYKDLAAWVTSPRPTHRGALDVSRSVHGIIRYLRLNNSVSAEDAGRIVALYAAMKETRPDVRKSLAIGDFISTHDPPRNYGFLFAVEPFRPSLRKAFGRTKFAEVQEEVFLELFREYYEEFILVGRALSPLKGTGLGDTVIGEFLGKDMRWETLNVLARFALRRGNADAFPAQEYAKKFAATLRSTKAAFRLSEFRASSKRPRARGDGKRSARRRLNSSSR
ncbi:Hypothetical Protein FCC1311_113732 [Hondaea fermentalgiana]|uniref:Uncharacterized protein n=1 Tax=Hondaea fermentalgiana TaxID=2315210 RepID=A0A2R5GWE3_9STRA|nr:Hypothetical Protein FCC1311_113732 [Hondaea fermentalgiana]|eukprot:GBG35150.1 Hypothetical Protein FCC1311_113732 [Hondaea fermentalgiana]